MRKSSIIFETEKEIMQKIFDESSTKGEILLRLGFSPNSGTMRQKLNERIDIGDIDLTIFNSNNKKLISEKNSKNTAIPLEDILIENSTYTNMTHLKKKLLDNKVMEYKCVLCGNNGYWNDKPLTLQLDHINGKHNDHRLCNLRFLCPNRHSQTDTYAGKNANIDRYK